MIQNNINGGVNLFNQTSGGAMFDAHTKLSEFDRDVLDMLVKQEPDGPTKSRSGYLRLCYMIVRQYPRDVREWLSDHPELVIELVRNTIQKR